MQKLLLKLKNLNCFFSDIPIMINDRFYCEMCSKTYKYKRGWTQHRKYECGKIPGFACNYCPYRCHQKSSLTYHLNNKHLMQYTGSFLRKKRLI